MFFQKCCGYDPTQDKSYREKNTATVEERLNRLEDGYEHLATKADLYQLENRMTRWLVSLVVTVAVLAVSVAGFSFKHSWTEPHSIFHHLYLLVEVPCNRVVRPYPIYRMCIQNRCNFFAFLLR